jgi:hypothetical protein
MYSGTSDDLGPKSAKVFQKNVSGCPRGRGLDHRISVYWLGAPFCQTNALHAKISQGRENVGPHLFLFRRNPHADQRRNCSGVSRGNGHRKQKVSAKLDLRRGIGICRAGIDADSRLGSLRNPKAENRKILPKVHQHRSLDLYRKSPSSGCRHTKALRQRRRPNEAVVEGGPPVTRGLVHRLKKVQRPNHDRPFDRITIDR